MGNIVGALCNRQPKEKEKEAKYDDIINLVGAICGYNIGLTGDTFVAILSFLPVKSLIRFRSVCKPWKLLIDSTAFVDIHLHRKYPQFGQFPVDIPRTFGSQQVQGIVFPVDINFIVGTCNGILCLCTFNPRKSLILCNPSIREFSFLPPEFRGGFYAFCYLSKTQEYKVFGFTRFRWSNKVDIRIMTLGKNKSIRYVEDILPGYITRLNHATSRTSMFWLGVDYNEDYGENHNSDHLVICYDYIEEKFSKMNVPPPSSSSKYYRSLAVVKKSVMMFVYPKCKATFFDIWILIEDKSWTRYHKVGPLETNVLMSPAEFCRNGRWIRCVKHHPSYRSRDYFYYDLQTDQVEDYKANDPPTWNFCDYVDSLVSINSLVPYIDTEC